MIVLSHRGYWLTKEEKNTLTAFNRSISLGFGTETDIRDCLGQLVISHDMPIGQEMTFADFLALWPQKTQLPLALNIKADGLAAKVKQILADYDYQNYFLFDMSIPDMVQCLKHDLKVFARVSDIEKQPCCYGQVKGIWLDAFFDTWYQAKDIQRFLDDGKQVCIVSPELHGRPYHNLWQMLLDDNLHKHPNLLLCTDVPEEAVKFLGLDND